MTGNIIYTCSKTCSSLFSASPNLLLKQVLCSSKLLFWYVYKLLKFKMYGRILVSWLQDLSSCPSGQPRSVTHCSAAFTKDSRGETATGTAVPHHALQPPEPSDSHPATLASIQWRGGTHQLRQPSWRDPIAKHQQGKRTKQVLLCFLLIFRLLLSCYFELSEGQNAP